MPLITQQELKNLAGPTNRIGKHIREQKQSTKSLAIDAKFDIFLSHCFIDQEYILGLKNLFAIMGYTTYVDWDADVDLDRCLVTAKTAELLKHRMNHCKCLFYAVSGRSAYSKWMPWELGYSDGVHGHVAIVPIQDQPSDSEEYRGIEYLGIYPYVVEDIHTDTNRQDIWIHKSEEEFIHFPKWLDGEPILSA